MNVLREMNQGRRKAIRLAREAGRATPGGSGGTIALAVVGVGIAGAVLYFMTRGATTATAAVTPTTSTLTPSTPSAPWVEITGQAVNVPAGAQVAMSVANPSAAMVTELNQFSMVPATQATNVQIFPVGTPPPASFPNDGGGTTAFRILLTDVVGGLNGTANLNGLRTWMRG
jgi:hypothetical protein